MAEGRDRQLWDHTANLMALLANCLGRGKGKPAFHPRQFHPHYQQEAREPDVKLDRKESMDYLRRVFGEKGSRRRN